jgi:hypothetical protein
MSAVDQWGKNILALVISIYNGNIILMEFKLVKLGIPVCEVVFVMFVAKTWKYAVIKPLSN